MKSKNVLTIAMVTAVLAVVGGTAISAGDKYTVKVPGGSRSPSSGDTKTGRLSPPVWTEDCWPRSSLIL